MENQLKNGETVPRPPWLSELRDEIAGLREEVRSLRGERDPERNISTEEAAELAGVSERKMQELVHTGEVPSLKIGRRRLLPYKAFTAWMRRRTRGAER